MDSEAYGFIDYDLVSLNIRSIAQIVEYDVVSSVIVPTLSCPVPRFPW